MNKKWTKNEQKNEQNMTKTWTKNEQKMNKQWTGRGRGRGRCKGQRQRQRQQWLYKHVLESHDETYWTRRRYASKKCFKQMLQTNASKKCLKQMPLKNAAKECFKQMLQKNASKQCFKQRGSGRDRGSHDFLNTFRKSVLCFAALNSRPPLC